MVEYTCNDIIRTPWKADGRIQPLESCNEIFHYTSSEGFNAIITNETLRFTNALCLNDAAEIKDGMDEILRYMDNRLSMSDTDTSATEALFKIRNAFNETLNSQGKHTFFFSASMDHDNLAMWRYYSKGKEMNGFGIGFDYCNLIRSLLLLNHVVLVGSTMSYGSAVYESLQKQQIILDATDISKFQLEILFGKGLIFLGESSADTAKDLNAGILSDLEQFKKELDEKIENPPRPKEALHVYSYHESTDNGEQSFKNGSYTEAVMFSKNRSFKYEQEVRIAIVFNEDQYSALVRQNIIKSEFRNGINTLYLDLKFDLSAITSMYSAPKIEQAFLRKANKLKDSKSSIAHIPIVPSESTVRF